MAIAKSVSIVIIFFALANYADAAMRPRPPVGHDIFGDNNHAKDVVLPGEKLVNVESFGAKGDGVTDSTQVQLYHILSMDIKMRRNISFLPWKLR